MNLASIPPAFRRAILDQAEQAYPRECCGFILGPRDEKNALSRLAPCRNAQDDFHAADPAAFSRDAKTAFFIHPEELLAVHHRACRDGEAIRVIYHSHADAPARFSAEDLRFALDRGRPAYPDTGYLIVSVARRKTRNFKLFCWRPDGKGYVS